MNLLAASAKNIPIEIFKIASFNFTNSILYYELIKF